MSQAPAEGPNTPGRPEGLGLRAELGLLDTTLLVMGNIIGAGIFFSPSQVALHQPSAAGILSTWIAGGVLALTGAFVFAELGGLFPRTGGQYVYLREAHGKRLAFIYGWHLLALVASGAIAVVVGISISHLEAILGELWGEPARQFPSTVKALLGTLIIALFTWLNVRGVKLGAWVHNAFMALKISSLLLVALLGAHAAFSASAPAAASPAASGGGGAGINTAQLVPALLAALFSYGGWQNAASVAGEVRGAATILPRAIVAGTLGVIALYLAVNLALLAILGAEGIAGTQTPVADAAGRVLGPSGRVLVAGMVIISTLGITHAVILTAPRVYHAMALDGLFFAICRHRHARHATPDAAIVLQGGFALLHFLIATFRKDVGTLLDSLVFVDWLFFALAGAGFFLCRWRLPAAPRPFRAPFYPWLPLIFLVLSGAIVAWTLVGSQWQTLIVPALVFTAGLALLARGERRGRAGGSAQGP